MSATLIVQLLEVLAALTGEVAPLVAQGKSVLAESDAVRIRQALAKAQNATQALRPLVDAALDAAKG